MSQFPSHPGDFFVYGDGQTVRHGISEYYNAYGNYTRACVENMRLVVDAITAPYRLEAARLKARTRAFCQMLESFVSAGEQATRQIEALSRALPAPGLSHDERMALISMIGQISERGRLPSAREISGLLGQG